MIKTRTTILTSAALMLAFGLTGCASTEMQQQEVPSATSTPSASASATPGSEETTEAPVEEQGEEIVDELPTIESTVPTEVVEQYGDYAGTLLESGNSLISLTQGEMGDLQQARDDEEEITYYEPLREHMTESAWTQIETALASEDKTARERAEGFIPQADRAGNLATIDDVAYDVVEPGVIAFPLSEAAIALTPEGGEGVTWTQTVQVIAYATPENLSFEREVTLWLVPAPDGGWEINDWHASEALDGVKVGE